MTGLNVDDEIGERNTADSKMHLITMSKGSFIWKVCENESAYYRSKVVERKK